MNSETVDGRAVKQCLRKAISDFCRWRITQGFCDNDDCTLCEVDRTYELAEDDPFDDHEEL